MRYIPMSKRKNFVTTTSKDVANELKKSGLHVVQEGNGKWTFLNDSTINFENQANSNQVVYTDILSI